MTLVINSIYLRLTRGSIFLTKRWLVTKHYGTDKLMVYDSRTRSKRAFKPLIPGIIKWYQCGPTVYADSHIGHAATYVRFDIIRRILSSYFNYRVLQVMCITDIDDKIIASANKQGIPYGTLARKYEKEFFDDMDKLGVGRPLLTMRVTEQIPEIVSFVQRIIDNNLAYLVPDGSVYFDVASYGSRYNVFSNVQSAIPDVAAVPGKRSPSDFALWKSCKSGEPYWSATWIVDGKKMTSKGRPGWHIECSTLSTLALGNQFDIHTGGEDLAFPHHQNELAQSVAAGCVADEAKWVGHWLHSGHLHVPSTGSAEKMSKSLGNVFSISQMLSGLQIGDAGSLSASEFRTLVCLCHYRDRIVITAPRLNEAKNTWRRIEDFCQNMRAWASDQLSPTGIISEAELLQKISSFERDTFAKLSDDLNIPGVFKDVDALIGDVNRSLSLGTRNIEGHTKISRNFSLLLLETIGSLTQMVGLPNPDPLFKTLSQSSADFAKNNVMSAALSSALDFRAAVRCLALEKKQDHGQLLKLCDELRSDLSDKGVVIKDTNSGKATWSLK